MAFSAVRTNVVFVAGARVTCGRAVFVLVCSEFACLYDEELEKKFYAKAIVSAPWREKSPQQSVLVSLRCVACLSPLFQIIFRIDKYRRTAGRGEGSAP